MKNSRCSAFCVLLRAPPFASFDKVGSPAGRSIPPTNNTAIFHCVVWKAAMTRSSLGHSFKSFIYLFLSLAEENEGDDSADHALITDVLILLESQRVIVIVHSGPLSLARYFLPSF
eukprot:scaffold785_cov301-Chaetoceros_neogracile.AAC.11